MVLRRLAPSETLLIPGIRERIVHRLFTERAILLEPEGELATPTPASVSDEERCEAPAPSEYLGCVAGFQEVLDVRKPCFVTHITGVSPRVSCRDGSAPTSSGIAAHSVRSRRSDRQTVRRTAADEQQSSQRHIALAGAHGAARPPAPPQQPRRGRRSSAILPEAPAAAGAMAADRGRRARAPAAASAASWIR